MRLLIAGLAGIALAFGAVVAPQHTSEAAPPTSGSLTQTVTGTVGGGTFTGDLDITRFTSRGGQLYAVGT